MEYYHESFTNETNKNNASEYAFIEGSDPNSFYFRDSRPSNYSNSNCFEFSARLYVLSLLLASIFLLEVFFFRLHHIEPFSVMNDAICSMEQKIKQSQETAPSFFGHYRVRWF